MQRAAARPAAGKPTSTRSAPAKPAPAGPAPQAAARPDWNDGRLRVKVALLVMLAIVGGVGLGMVEAHLGHRVWPLLAGLAALVGALLTFGARWACQPIESLVERIDRADQQDRPTVLATLPTARNDEVGKLARALHYFSQTAARDNRDARQLRRTIDARIERATRLATKNLKELAMRDPLTDLGNRRFLDENLPDLVTSCALAGSDLLCVLIDIDNFKILNDTLGHAAGDDLLRALGSLLKATIRREDYAVRLGGDEFVLLMPNCPFVRLREMGDQLITLFAQHARIVMKGDVKPSLSLGAASLLRDAIATPAELLKRADANLYEAKRAGKARLVGA